MRDHRDHARRIVADGGFIATEYRSIDSTHRGNFLARNRIVAGMADVTVVDKVGGVAYERCRVRGYKGVAAAAVGVERPAGSGHYLATTPTPWP